MTYTFTRLREFLAGVSPFNQLSPAALDKLSERSQLVRYRMGQAIMVREKMPTEVVILYEGQARLLGFDQRTNTPVTLKKLEPGEIIGAASLVRQVACETAIASVESIILTLPVSDFLALLELEPTLNAAFRDQCFLIEVFDLLGAELARQALGSANLKELALQAWPQAVVGYQSTQLNPERLWFVSGGVTTNFPVGSRLTQSDAQALAAGVRLVGIPASVLGETETQSTATTHEIVEIDYAPDLDRLPNTQSPATKSIKYPHVRGRGPVDAALACFQMLSKHLGVSCRRDVIRRVLDNQLENSGSLSLQFCGAVAELMGLKAQLVNVPATSVSRLPVPAMIRWQDSFAILYEVTEKELVLAVPEEGIRRRKIADFIDLWDAKPEVLLLSPPKDGPKERFSLRWFLPALSRYRKVLLEVLIASFFVQLFGLANPLMTQVIIDKVLMQNSLDTLHVLGVLLVVLAIFEAILTSLRTYLFADTTNRIDLALGSEIIDHLLRLPLPYFGRRPVGELASRINELENIRQFLTGTALTVVLDAVFSLIYIVVMAVYSPLLTVVALATIPLFLLLSFLVSPIMRRQLRVKAERYAQTQSYLVEVVSGISTVKAQNIELRSRWEWQQRYARYVSASFQSVLTSTTASSTSNFLNKLSGLLVLWVGAYLVLAQQLTLGQLIAFRIIAGYVTSPLLRLVQLWQNFQETALSIERLSDILDSPQETDEIDRTNIPMPAIQGSVKYENISFRFTNSGPLQLSNINLEFHSGVFVGIVGQSGSGKSTLMKLLPRLYEPEAGRIIIDGYDISKVELYSLRRQIGIVPQETLLFDGTVQENIALTHPDATVEEIISAAKIAVAHDFIMDLPSGYNTRVGERGAALSGGQRQRIALARTVLQNPRLLILDEATSALDYDSERQVCLNLAEAFRGRTVFFITHRLSTIRNADIILMMDKGSVVEQGTHSQLMALKGRYYCLYLQQESQM